jgi:hypothetical protein
MRPQRHRNVAEPLRNAADFKRPRAETARLAVSVAQEIQKEMPVPMNDFCHLQRASTTSETRLIHSELAAVFRVVVFSYLFVVESCAVLRFAGFELRILGKVPGASVWSVVGLEVWRCPAT